MSTWEYSIDARNWKGFEDRHGTHRRLTKFYEKQKETKDPDQRGDVDGTLVVERGSALATETNGGAPYEAPYSTIFLHECSSDIVFVWEEVLGAVTTSQGNRKPRDVYLRFREEGKDLGVEVYQAISELGVRLARGKTPDPVFFQLVDQVSRYVFDAIQLKTNYAARGLLAQKTILTVCNGVFKEENDDFTRFVLLNRTLCVCAEIESDSECEKKLCEISSCFQ